MNPTRTLAKYLTTGYTDRRSRFLSHFSKYKIAEDLFSRIEWQTLSCEEVAEKPATAIRIESSGKSNLKSHPVFRYLEANPHPAIISSFIFGSLADGSACPYSDFDGILVIDCSNIQSAVSLLRLRKIISRTEEMMLETDPLQHHGWHFILTDAERRIIDMDLPEGILSECQVMTPSQPVELRLCHSLQQNNAVQICKQTMASIRRKLADERTIQNIYAFKSLCSEFMLMPTLLLQAIGNPVSKKESFKSIEKFLTSYQLSALRTVSEWRKNWRKPELDKRVKLFHTLKKSGIRLPFFLPKVSEDLKQHYPSWTQNAEQFLQACEYTLQRNEAQL